MRFLDADAVAALAPVAAVLASANACRRFARVRFRVLAASLAGASRLRIAMSSALVTNAAVFALSIDQPITRRDQVSSTSAQ